MKTKNIFKSLAFAMLMPAMLLTTACSSDDDLTNNEPTAKESYKIPVTVNVTRQGDATRAEYDATTKKLSFSEGDKLLVDGYMETYDVTFAGILTWTSGGTFSGELDMDGTYSGTVEEMFTEASSGYPNYINATLLPNGYKGYNFLHIEGTGAGQKLEDPNYYCGYPVAGDLATAVEQFSLEQAFTYSSGFALAPQRAIVNCSYKDASHANKDCLPYIAMYNHSEFAGGGVKLKFSAGGIVNFAISVPPYNDKWILSASDGENDLFEVNLGTKILEEGHIYNITRAAAAAGPVTYTVLNGGEVLHPGDIIDVPSGQIWNIIGGYIFKPDWSPLTVLRANVVPGSVTEDEDGAYYVIKDKDGIYYFDGGSLLPVTSTSDGILVTKNSANNYTFTVHEP